MQRTVEALRLHWVDDDTVQVFVREKLVGEACNFGMSGAGEWKTSDALKEYCARAGHPIPRGVSLTELKTLLARCVGWKDRERSEP